MVFSISPRRPAAGSRPRSTRAPIAFALAVGLAVPLAACSGGSEPTPSDTVQISDGKTLSEHKKIEKGAAVGVLVSMDSAMGETLKPALEKAGFKVDYRQVQSAKDQLPVLKQVIDTKPAVIVVDALDALALKPRLKEAHDAGITVVALDSLPTTDRAVDFYVGFHPRQRGEAQVKALMTWVTNRPVEEGRVPRVEFMAGDFGDIAAKAQWDGALAGILEPIKQHTVEGPAGEESYGTASTMGTVEQRLKSFLPKYADGAPDGIIAADDAQAVATGDALTALKKPRPVLIGAKSSLSGVKALMAGRLTATTWDDPAKLAEAVSGLITDMTKDGPLAVDPESLKDGDHTVPSRFVSPVAAISQNDARKTYADTPALKALVK